MIWFVNAVYGFFESLILIQKRQNFVNCHVFICNQILGSEGKLTLTEQKLSALRAVGNMSRNTVSGTATLQNLSTTVAELFIPLLSSEGMSNEPSGGKNKYLCCRPGPTQFGLYSHRSRLEAWNLGCKKKDCTIHVAKAKALISCAIKCL